MSTKELVAGVAEVRRQHHEESVRVDGVKALEQQRRERLAELRGKRDELAEKLEKVKGTEQEDELRRSLSYIDDRLDVYDLARVSDRIMRRRARIVERRRRGR